MRRKSYERDMSLWRLDIGEEVYETLRPKGVWFKIWIQGVKKCKVFWNLIITSVYIICNIFLLYIRMLSFIYKYRCRWSNHIKTFCIFVYDLSLQKKKKKTNFLFFFILSYQYLNKKCNFLSYQFLTLLQYSNIIFHTKIKSN